MSIMEKNLPIAESFGEGDKLRIVTAEGSSKQINASEIGGSSSSGSVMVVTLSTNDQDEYIADKTLEEIWNHVNNGGYAVLRAGPEYYLLHECSQSDAKFVQIEFFDFDESKSLIQNAFIVQENYVVREHVQKDFY